MHKQTIIIFILIAIFSVTACASSGQASTLPPTPETVLPTQTLIQPTLPLAPAETASSTATDNASVAASFADDILPIFEARCIKCHGVDQTKEGLDLQTYDNLLAGSFNGPVIEAGNASNSLLIELIVKGKMPNRGPKVTPKELQLITDWINQGAVNN